MLSVMEAVCASAILEFITHWPKGSTPTRTTLRIPYDIRTHILLLLSHLITHWPKGPTVNTNTGKLNQWVDNACLSSSHIILELITHILRIIVNLSYQSLSRTHYRGQHLPKNQGKARGGQFLPLISHWRAPQLARIYTIPIELTKLWSSAQCNMGSVGQVLPFSPLQLQLPFHLPSVIVHYQAPAHPSLRYIEQRLSIIEACPAALIMVPANGQHPSQARKT